MRHAPRPLAPEAKAEQDATTVTTVVAQRRVFFAEDAPTSAGLNTVRYGAVHIVFTD